MPELRSEHLQPHDNRRLRRVWRAETSDGNNGPAFHEWIASIRIDDQGANGFYVTREDFDGAVDSGDRQGWSLTIREAVCDLFDIDTEPDIAVDGDGVPVKYDPHVTYSFAAETMAAKIIGYPVLFLAGCAIAAAVFWS